MGGQQEKWEKPGVVEEEEEEEIEYFCLLEVSGRNGRNIGLLRRRKRRR